MWRLWGRALKSRWGVECETCFSQPTSLTVLTDSGITQNSRICVEPRGQGEFTDPGGVKPKASLRPTVWLSGLGLGS